MRKPPVTNCPRSRPLRMYQSNTAESRDFNCGTTPGGASSLRAASPNEPQRKTAGRTRQGETDGAGARVRRWRSVREATGWGWIDARGRVPCVCCLATRTVPASLQTATPAATADRARGHGRTGHRARHHRPATAPDTRFHTHPLR